MINNTTTKGNRQQQFTHAMWCKHTG